jgi:hypothetical protein
MMMARDVLKGSGEKDRVGVGAAAALNAIDDAYRALTPASSAADAHERVVAALKRGLSLPG